MCLTIIWPGVTPTKLVDNSIRLVLTDFVTAILET